MPYPSRADPAACRPRPRHLALGRRSAGHHTAEVAALRERSRSLPALRHRRMCGEGGAERARRALRSVRGGRGGARRGLRRQQGLSAQREPPGTVALRAQTAARLGLDRIDPVPALARQPSLAETLRAFEGAAGRGPHRRLGCEQLRRSRPAELAALPGGAACATNRSGTRPPSAASEFDLRRGCAHGMPLMALTTARSTMPRWHKHPQLDAVARRLGATAAQVALAWLLRGDVVAIPKAVVVPLRANHRGSSTRARHGGARRIDRAFAPPRQVAAGDELIGLPALRRGRRQSGPSCADSGSSSPRR